jgi:hypothetical protein
MESPLRDCEYQQQKPPREYEHLSEALFLHLLETLSHNFLQKAEVIDCFKSA